VAELEGLVQAKTIPLECITIIVDWLVAEKEQMVATTRAHDQT